MNIVPPRRNEVKESKSGPSHVVFVAIVIVIGFNASLRGSGQSFANENV